MNPNSTQSGAVNISVKIANPTTTGEPLATHTTTITPPIQAIEYQPIPINIFIIFSLVLHYLMTAYAVNNPLFPINRNYTIPPKGIKATVWKVRALPLMIAILTGLYGFIMAKTIPILIYNLIIWYFVFIEYILPKFSDK